VRPGGPGAKREAADLSRTPSGVKDVTGRETGSPHDAYLVG
jgi:hypothetical protein